MNIKGSKSFKPDLHASLSKKHKKISVYLRTNDTNNSLTVYSCNKPYWPS